MSPACASRSSSGCEVPALLDELQDGRRVVLGVVDEALLGERRDDDRRHARARAPLVDHRRRDVVPAAAVLVVGDDDGGVVPVRAVLDRADQIGDVLLAVEQGGVAGVLVVGAERLDERHGGQLCRRRRPCRSPSSSLQVLGPAGRAVGVVGVERERLVVELEQRIGVAERRRCSSRPSTTPSDMPCVAQAVADRRRGLLRDEQRLCR